jgi:hypothetical protein
MSIYFPKTRGWWVKILYAGGQFLKKDGSVSPLMEGFLPEIIYWLLVIK